MRFALFLALAFLAACAPSGPKSSGSAPISAGIFGGQEVQSNHPLSQLVVGLYNTKTGSKCTGTLIEDDVVLTAGHCVDPKYPEMSVVFSTSFENKSKMVRASSFIRHPRYNQKRTEGVDTFDLALVRFLGGIPDGYKKTALNTDFTPLAQLNFIFVAAGFGYSNPIFGTGSGTLRTTQLPFRKIHSATEFQTSQSSKGVCSGDSGGPLFQNVNGNFIQVGVASRVAPRTLFCRDYAIYTRVDIYLDWIFEGTQQLRN